MFIIISSYFYLFIYEAEVEPSPQLLQSFIGLLYQPWMIDGDDCGAIGGINECQGKLKYLEDRIEYLFCLHGSLYMI
jgi:hypothetical protein